MPGPLDTGVAIVGAIIAGEVDTRNKGIIVSKNVGVKTAGEIIDATLQPQFKFHKGESYMVAEEDGEPGSYTVVRGTKRKLIQPFQMSQAKPIKVTHRGRVHEEDEDGVQYYDKYIKAYKRKVHRRTTTKYRPKRYSKFVHKTPQRTYKRWGMGGRAGRPGAGRPYGRMRGTYGRWTYGTGRRSKQSWTRRSRYWYR